MRSPTDAEDIAAQIGRRALDELLAAHRLWIEWLDAGRVRKLALVAEPALGAAGRDATFYCPVGDHRADRMEGTLTVS